MLVLHSSYAVTHRRPSRKPVTLAPRSPSAPPSCAVWAVLAAGWALPLPAVPAPCAGAVAAFWAVNPSSMRRLCSVAMVCSKKVLNCSSVSGMVSGSSFSKSPMRLQSRFVLSLRSCSFCSWISRFFLFAKEQNQKSQISPLTTSLETAASKTAQIKCMISEFFLRKSYLRHRRHDHQRAEQGELQQRQLTGQNAAAPSPAPAGIEGCPLLRRQPRPQTRQAISKYNPSPSQPS